MKRVIRKINRLKRSTIMWFIILGFMMFSICIGMIIGASTINMQGDIFSNVLALFFVLFFLITLVAVELADYYEIVAPPVPVIIREEKPKQE